MECCTGKILEVDLSTGTTKVSAVPNEVYEMVLGGKGLAVWYLLKNIPANADHLGPDNILGFMTGALTGTGAFMCGRWLVCGKSPLTGGWGDASCGGMFAAAIKQCGYDGIFVRGISDKPVYLYADNKTVEIRDASAYWGKGPANQRDCSRKITGSARSHQWPALAREARAYRSYRAYATRTGELRHAAVWALSWARST